MSSRLLNIEPLAWEEAKDKIVFAIALSLRLDFLLPQASLFAHRSF